MNNLHIERVLLNAIHKDKALSPFQISLFTAMIALWQEQQYVHPFRVSRCKLMAASGIRSQATYHKCLKLLVSRHHILYEPSFDPNKGSLIHWPVMKYGEQVEANRRDENMVKNQAYESIHDEEVPCE